MCQLLGASRSPGPCLTQRGGNGSDLVETSLHGAAVTACKYADMLAGGARRRLRDEQGGRLIQQAQNKKSYPVGKLRQKNDYLPFLPLGLWGVAGFARGLCAVQDSTLEQSLLLRPPAPQPPRAEAPGPLQGCGSAQSPAGQRRVSL